MSVKQQQKSILVTPLSQTNQKLWKSVVDTAESESRKAGISIKLSAVIDTAESKKCLVLFFNNLVGSSSLMCRVGVKRQSLHFQKPVSRIGRTILPLVEHMYEGQVGQIYLT